MGPLGRKKSSGIAPAVALATFEEGELNLGRPRWASIASARLARASPGVTSGTQVGSASAPRNSRHPRGDGPAILRLSVLDA